MIMKIITITRDDRMMDSSNTAQKYWREISICEMNHIEKV